MVKVLPTLEPRQISDTTILIVPSVDHPPRVPKVLTAIAFGMKIIDFKWVVDQRESTKTLRLSNYEMEYQSVHSLFSDYQFIVPAKKEIVAKNSKTQSIYVDFLKTLVLQGGGQLLSANRIRAGVSRTN